MQHLKKLSGEVLHPFNVNISDFENDIKVGKFIIRKFTRDDKQIFQKHFWGESESKIYICPFTLDYNMSENGKFLNAIPLLKALSLYLKKTIFAPHAVSKDSQIGERNIFKKFASSTLKSKDFYDIYKISLLLIELERKKESKSKRKLCLAMERYMYAIHSDMTLGNIFIEIVSITESIILDDNINEVSFRFALISSYILSNKCDVKVSFEEMKSIYTTRSNLVHSGKTSKNINEYFQNSNKYLATLLLWFLKQGAYSEKEILKEIYKTFNI